MEENITEEDFTKAGKRLPGGNGTVYERNVSISGEIGSVEGSIPRQSLPWLVLCCLHTIYRMFISGRGKVAGRVARGTV